VPELAPSKAILVEAGPGRSGFGRTKPWEQANRKTAPRFLEIPGLRAGQKPDADLIEVEDSAWMMQLAI
jgi:hypothetical protein